MYRRSITIALTFALLLLVSPVSAGVQVQQVTAPMTYSIATIGDAETLDPHWAYDTASAGIIFQVYETLVDFKGGRTDANIPELATEWSITNNGTTYTFKIREGITFTDGSALTAGDVEYSFERGMVRSRAGGPMWMLFEPLLGIPYGSARSYGDLSDPAIATQMGQDIDAAVESNGTHVWFNLASAYGPFIQILSQSWASILDYDYMLSIGDFPGFNVTGYDNWGIYNDYKLEETTHGFRVSPLDDPPQMMGTGPFKFKEWVKKDHLTLIRNVDYWGGWPAGAEGTARAGDVSPPSRGYIDTYIEFQVPEWSARNAGLIAGTYDAVYVPRENIAEVWQQEGIRCRYPLTSLAVAAAFFNFNIANGDPSLSPYIGSGQLDGNGIPVDFFSDINVRKAFVALFDGDKYILERYLGEAYRPATPIIPGLAPIPTDDALAWHLANAPSYDLVQAAAYLQQAWGGNVSSKGFKFSYIYNEGNAARQATGEMLRDALKLIEPSPGMYDMTVVAVPWPTFLGAIWPPETAYRSTMPIFNVGWLADYPDAHNFAAPFMHSYGDFSYPQNYSNPDVDALIEQGIAETDTAARIAIYEQLNQLYLDDAPSFVTVTGFGRRWERDWVQGWYYNPIFPASDLYTIWKEDLPWEDVNADGKVNIADLTVAAKAFGSYFIADLPPYPTGDPGTFASNWDSRPDVNQDMKVNIADLTKMALLFGYSAEPWTPP